MVHAGILVGLGCALAAHAATTCLLDLEDEALTGPNSCTPQWAEQDASIAQCFHECAAVQYELEGGFTPSKPNMVNAHPKQGSTCSNPQRPLTCGAFVLTCSKPFGEFPNACSGKSDLKEFITTYGRFYVALYAFRNATEDGASQPTLVTRVVADATTMCSGAYKLTQGSCLGLDGGAGEAVAPPEPPPIYGMPVPFPKLDEYGRRATTTVTTTSQTSTMTKTTTATTSSVTSTKAPVRPKPHNPSNVNNGNGNGFLIGFLVVVLILAALAVLWFRRKRMAREGRSLVNSQEMESMSNRY